MEQSLENLQRDVQRRLGRNLIRLQQIERMLKVMVAEQEIVTMSDARDERQCRHADVEKKTLGQVAERYFDTVAVPEGAPLDKWEPADVTKPVFRTTFKIAMPEESREAHKKQWDELIELRNQLVHHFLEIHDIWTTDGCKSASAYLDTTYDTINRHFTGLNQTFQVMTDVRKGMGEYIKSEAFGDYLLYGVRPDGSGVDWATAPIVALLRNAESELSEQGWISLDDAIAWMRAKHSDHTPKKYRCSTWRQVLHESMQFEIRRDKGADGDFQSVTYYRSASPKGH